MTDREHLGRVFPAVVVLAFLLMVSLPWALSPTIQGAQLGQPETGNAYARQTLDDRLVFTYYFYWYDWTSGAHMWDNESNGCYPRDQYPARPNCRENCCPDHNVYHPVDQESVAWTNPHWHYREFQDMMQAGIDVLLPVFWGGLETEWSQQGLPYMNTALNWLRGNLSLRPANQQNPLSVTNPVPKVGMFFDTTLMHIAFNENTTDGRVESTADLTNDSHCEFFYETIVNFTRHFDAENLQEVPGEAGDDPAYVVWLYGTNWFQRTSQDCIDYCTRRFQAEYNHSLVFVGTPSWGEGCPRLEGFYSWGTAVNGPDFQTQSPIRVASIGPGAWNGNENIGAVCQVGQGPYHTPRSPTWFAANLSTVLAWNPNWVVVETWNELHEGTSICRTVEYGDTYINVTANFSQQFHQLPTPVSPKIPPATLWARYWGIVPVVVTGVLLGVAVGTSRRKNF